MGNFLHTSHVQMHSKMMKIGLIFRVNCKANRKYSPSSNIEKLTNVSYWSNVGQELKIFVINFIFL